MPCASELFRPFLLYSAPAESLSIGRPPFQMTNELLSLPLPPRLTFGGS